MIAVQDWEHTSGELTAAPHMSCQPRGISSSDGVHLITPRPASSATALLTDWQAAVQNQRDAPCKHVSGGFIFPAGLSGGGTSC